ncbi:MAG: hypothetical protein AABZ57_04920 [Candidatus Margulisiibacteriota bacterium]
MISELYFHEGRTGGRKVYTVLRQAADGYTERAFSINAGGGSIGEYSVADSDGKLVNPLWTPHWRQIEPHRFDAANTDHTNLYGAGCDGPLLSGISGANTCFPVFGGDTDGALGGAHGEANIVEWEHPVFNSGQNILSVRAGLPKTQWSIIRKFTFSGSLSFVTIKDSYLNLSAGAKNVTYAQHVTLGWPFLENARIYMPDNICGHTFPLDFFEPEAGGENLQRLMKDQTFVYPYAPGKHGEVIALDLFPTQPQSDCTTQFYLPNDPNLSSDQKNDIWFAAFDRGSGVLLGCIWPKRDFPFLVRWVENLARQQSPWCDAQGEPATRALGLELSNTPFPIGLDYALEHPVFAGYPTYRAVGPGETFTTEFKMFAFPMPEAKTYDNFEVLNVVNRGHDVQVDTSATVRPEAR